MSTCCSPNLKVSSGSVRVPHRATSFVFFFLSFGLCAGGAHAAPYTFSEIAQTDAYPGQQFYIVTGPAINESGTVAFRQISGGGDGIYTRSPGGPIVPVATTAGGVFASFGPNPDINDSGTVVFHAIPRAGGEGLYLASPGGPVRTAVDTSQGFSTFVTGRYNPPGVAFPAINNAGVVVSAGVRTGSPDNVFLRYDGATVTVPYATRDLTQPDINNRGDAVFYAQDNRGQEEMYLADVTGVNSLNEHAASETDLTESPTLNDNGVIAYSYTFNGGIVVRDATGRHEYVGGGVYRLPQGGGGFSLNNRGDFAYVTNDFQVIPTTILTGPIEALQPVITVGAPLFGSTVAKLYYSREGFNDAGQIAFWATLSDGRSVIVLAEPVPEPSSLAIVLISVAFFGWRPRRVPA